MGNKVLLISDNRCTLPDPVFPLGLAYLNSALRRAGHDTHWVDSLAGAERIEDVLDGYPPDVVGISVRNIDDVIIRKRETFFDHLSALGETIRQTVKCPVVLGGSGFSIFPRQLLQLTGAEYGICGEGEAGFVSLLAALNNGCDFSGIPGLVYRENGNILINPPAGSPDGQILAEGDRPATVSDYYLRTSGMLNIQTQRGCASQCCYCTYPIIEGRHHRSRSADAVGDEFEQVQRLGARYVFIVDSVFNSSPRHVAEICEAILRRNVKLAWGCFLRPQGLTPELMKLMKRAGLAHIEFGSDSFCDEVLAAYQKGLTFDDILHASELANQENIDFCHFLISGGPGETRETLRCGFEASLRIKNAVIIAVVGMRIYPGTRLFQQAVAEGCIDQETDLLAPAYYLAPGLMADEVFARLQAFARLAPSWIIGDPGPAYTRLVERLRKKGAVGPLWSYFSTIQRLWPHGVNGK
ncbi:MAG: lipid biosynthesis B12-binding/radical SAM protein [Verrucomicrobiia bacterium]